MDKKLVVFFLLIPLLVFASLIWARGGGSSSAYILTRTVNARASGLAEALGAVTDDVSSLCYNPALVASLSSKQISLMYNKGIADDTYATVLYGHPMGSFSFGINLFYYDANTLEFYDSNSSLQMKNAEKDIIGGMSIGTMIKKGLYAGISLKYLSSTLVEYKTANALAIDLGLAYSFSRRFTFGFSGSNFGSGLKYISESSQLPLLARCSLAYELLERKNNSLLLVGDVAYLYNEEQVIPAIGGEFKTGIFSLRAGSKFNSDTQGLNVGLGINVNNLNIDYAFGSTKELNNEHTISLRISFGKI